MLPETINDTPAFGDPAWRSARPDRKLIRALLRRRRI